MRRGAAFGEVLRRVLLAHGGLYARLWAHQSGGFLGEEADDELTEAAQTAS